jgi:hypothetical protein
VSASTRNDSNNGTPASPYKTITHALSLAMPGIPVIVLPGTYDAATNGETFPLNIPAGVSLIGDETNKGNGTPATIVQGTGVVSGVKDNSTTFSAEAAFLPATGSTIAGFYVIGVSPSAGNSGELILIETPVTNVTVRNNRLFSAQANGILEQAPGGNTITGNILASNGIAGFFSDCSTTGTPSCAGGVSNGDVLSGNEFAVNASSGATLLNSAGGGTYDFGGGGVSSGNNIFCGSPNGMSVNIFPGATIYATNNVWWFGNPPIVFNSFGPSIDIVNNNFNSTITSTPSFPVATTCP